MRKRFTDEQLTEEHGKKLTEKVMASNLGVSQVAISIRMKQIGLKPWNKYVPKITNENWRTYYGRVYYGISGNPGTCRDITQRTGIKNYESLKNILQGLKKLNKISSVSMDIRGCTGSTRYGSHDSVDGIAGLNVYYTRGDEQLLGSYITAHLPKKISLGLKRSLSYRMKHRLILPKEASKIVCDYIDTHTVKK